MFQRKSNRAVEEKFNLISGISGWRVYKPKLVFDYLKNSSGKKVSPFHCCFDLELPIVPSQLTRSSRWRSAFQPSLSLSITFIQ
jgi:hypothetical protein